jgi:hypothetical protein
MIVKKFPSLSLATLALVACWGGAAQSAEPAVGRITYIDPVGRRLMLDNANMYRLGPAVDISRIAVAERVKLRLTGNEAKRVITQIAPQPLS